MVSDRERIIEVAVRYCTAMDGRDWDLLPRVFAADAVVRYEGFEELRGIAALTEFLAGVLGPLDATQHITTNFSVEVDGDAAACSSYLHAQHVRLGTPGGDHFVFAGTYRDRLLRSGGEWLITERELATTWTEGNEAVLGG